MSQEDLAYDTHNTQEDLEYDTHNTNTALQQLWASRRLQQTWAMPASETWMQRLREQSLKHQPHLSQEEQTSWILKHIPDFANSGSPLVSLSADAHNSQFVHGRRRRLRAAVDLGDVKGKDKENDNDDGKEKGPDDEKHEIEDIPDDIKDWQSLTVDVDLANKTKSSKLQESKTPPTPKMKNYEQARNAPYENGENLTPRTLGSIDKEADADQTISSSTISELSDLLEPPEHYYSEDDDKNAADKELIILRTWPHTKPEDGDLSKASSALYSMAYFAHKNDRDEYPLELTGCPQRLLISRDLPILRKSTINAEMLNEILQSSFVYCPE